MECITNTSHYGDSCDLTASLRSFCINLVRRKAVSTQVCILSEDKLMPPGLWTTTTESRVVTTFRVPSRQRSSSSVTASAKRIPPSNTEKDDDTGISLTPSDHLFAASPVAPPPPPPPPVTTLTIFDVSSMTTLGREVALSAAMTDRRQASNKFPSRSRQITSQYKIHASLPEVTQSLRQSITPEVARTSASN